MSYLLLDLTTLMFAGVLGWLQQLSMDICAVKSVLEAQTLTCEKLREETVALDNRVSAIENLEDNSQAWDLGAVSVQNDKPTGEGSTGPGGQTATTAAPTPRPPPEWVDVVRKGQQQRPRPKNAPTAQLKPRASQA